MSYEPDTSHHPRLAPTLVPLSPLAVCLLLCLSLFLSIYLYTYLFRSRLLIQRDTGLIVSPVAFLVDVGPNNDPNNGNNMDPCRRDVLSRSFYEFLLAHIGPLPLPLPVPSLASLLNRSHSKIAAVDEEASGRGDFVHCARR